MKLRNVFLSAALVVFGFAASPLVWSNIAADIKEGCSGEIDKYCSQVTLCEGRMLSCLYAHEDKLSGRCVHMLYQASASLKQAAEAMHYVAEQCRNDLLSHCADVEMGEGRVVQCLKSNSAVVTSGCKQAMTDVFE